MRAEVETSRLCFPWGPSFLHPDRGMRKPSLLQPARNRAMIRGLGKGRILSGSTLAVFPRERKGKTTEFLEEAARVGSTGPDPAASRKTESPHL